MEKHPLVSIVTICYNNFSHLKETILSVLEQDYEQIEYLIYDDCSEKLPVEEIYALFSQHKKENIIHFEIHQNKTNCGTVKNLNQAYQNARGEILMPLSCGDCFFSKSTVRKIVDRFSETQCEVLATSRVLYKNNFEPIGLMPHFKQRAYLNQLDYAMAQYQAFITYRFRDMCSGCILYIRKKSLEQMGYFDEKYDLWEDGPFFSRFLYEHSMSLAYDIVSIWYEDGGVSAKSFDDLSPRMRADVKIFAQTDAIAHIDTFPFWERRKICYRNKRLISGKSYKRLLLYIKYFPELMYYLAFTKKNTALSSEDQVAIQRAFKETPDILFAETSSDE